jgi:nucleotide-binding universal stress UspA family protein
VENVEAEARRAMEERVAATYLARVPAGVECRVEFRAGPEAATIIEYAAAERMDLLVLGRHGRGGVGQALFGSVAEKLVRRAPCPVLVVPLRYAQAEPGGGDPVT